jgi:hypothetical protein
MNTQYAIQCRAIQRTVFASFSFRRPSLSQPRSPNPRLQFLGYGHEKDLVERHGTIRGLTGSPRSRLDQPLRAISVRLAEREMGDGEGMSRRQRTLPRCRPIPDVFMLAVKRGTGRINCPYTTEERERKPLLGQINRDPGVGRVRQTN